MVVIKNSSYHALHVKDVGGVEAGGFFIWDGGLVIGHAERAGCVPVGGKFRFVWAGVVEAF